MADADTMPYETQPPLQPSEELLDAMAKADRIHEKLVSKKLKKPKRANVEKSQPANQETRESTHDCEKSTSTEPSPQKP